MNHENSSSFLAHANPKVGMAGRGTHWEFYSPRLKRRVVASSSYEYDHYVTLEMDPAVKTWVPQVEATAVVEGHECKRVIDATVTYWNGLMEAHEVKPEAQAQAEHTLRQLQFLAEWSKANGSVAKLVTEVQIRSEPVLLMSYHSMLPWARESHSIDEALARVVVGMVVGRKSPISIEEAADELRIPISALAPIVVREFRDRRFGLDVGVRPFGRMTFISWCLEV